MVALVVAAGRGRRLGGGEPKQFRPLLGRPVLAHTLRVFQAMEAIDAVVVAVPRAYVTRCREEIVQRYRLSKVRAVVAGGRERQGSVRRALAAIEGPCDLVVIHDGVRPLVSPAAVERAIRVAARRGAAVVARPVADTIKVADRRGRVRETPDRGTLYAAGTPQVFRRTLIERAHAQAVLERIQATDDATLVERLGEPVFLVEDDAQNLKITREEDFVLARAILRARRRNKR